jgi:lipopolysaccharide export system permease protein
VGGIFLGLLLWLANQYVVPKANVIRGNFEARYIDANSSYDALLQQGSTLYFRVDSFTYAGIYMYDTLNKRGGPLFVYTIKEQKATYNMRADQILWDTAQKKWKLEGILERKIEPMREKLEQALNRHIAYDFRPQDLVRDKYTKDKLTTPQLIRQIHIEELRGSEGLNALKVERYRRDATAVTVLLLTLIGGIVAGRKVRGGSGVHLALGFVMAALFIITDRFSTVFTTKGNLHPMVAAWIPNFVFVWVIVYLYRKAPK